MPSQKLLTSYRGGVGNAYAPRQANGAFWLNNSGYVPDFLEVEQEACILREGGIIMINDDVELEKEVSHLGNMIAAYSDAQVVDFDRRLTDAQNLSFQYQAAFRAGRPESELEALRLKAVNANLEIGYESRHYLQETLKKLSAYGRPLNAPVQGDLRIISESQRKNFVDALRDASTAYPSSWNQVLEDQIALRYGGSHKASYFDPSLNEMLISDVKGNFVSYPSFEKAMEAKARNEFMYETNVEMVHELGHKFEFIQPDIVRASRSFLRRRGFNAKNMDLHSNAVVQDHFTWDYVGQLYPSRHTEVFTVGMESTIRGTQGAAIGLALPALDDSKTIRHYRPDVEHRNLTLGILASMTMPFNNDNKGQPVQTMFGKVYPLPFK